MTMTKWAVKTARHVALAFVVALYSACASSTGIFPVISTSTSESEIVLPNPISVLVDSTNSQVLVANSNVDIQFNQGSIALLTVDASDTSAPILSATAIASVPNFAGEMHLDVSGNLFVPFREASASDSSMDTLVRYTIGSGSISESLVGTVSPDPFGITGDGSRVYVVSNDILGIYDSTLGLIETIDLTTADDADIESSVSTNVLSVALDASSTLAAVTNTSGRLFIVDLSVPELSQAVDGPLSSQNIIINGNTLYTLDLLTEAVWVFDLALLTAAGSNPEAVDDSEFLLETVRVGSGPFGMALDAAANRLYVSNTLEDSISVIDTVTLSEIARISIDQEDISSSFARDGEEPLSLALGTFNSTSYLFVACFKSNSIIMINTQTLQVVEVFPNTAL